MFVATLGSQVSGRSGNSFPRATAIEVSDTTGVDALSVSSELIGVPLPGMKSLAGSEFAGDAEVAHLFDLSISCDSTNFDLVILDVNDITKINASNVVHREAAINLRSNIKIDRLFTNRDTTRDNKLYFYIDNNGAGATGTITSKIGFLLYD